MMTMLVLLICPGLAHELPKRGFGMHLLSAQSVRLIEREIAT
jgi:hypothetical protein